jgi:hypothetical protein
LKTTPSVICWWAESHRSAASSAGGGLSIAAILHYKDEVFFQAEGCSAGQVIDARIRIGTCVLLGFLAAYLSADLIAWFSAFGASEIG